MQTFVLLTRIAPGSASSAHDLEELERKVMEQIRQKCEGVEWVSSYAVLGPWDYVDIFRAPDIDAASKVSALVRMQGHAETEIWAATEWRHSKDVIRTLSRPTQSQLP